MYSAPGTLGNALLDHILVHCRLSSPQPSLRLHWCFLRRDNRQISLSTTLYALHPCSIIPIVGILFNLFEPLLRMATLSVVALACTVSIKHLHVFPTTILAIRLILVF